MQSKQLQIRVKDKKPTKEELAVWADIDKKIAKGDFLVMTQTAGGNQIIELSASSIIPNTMSEIAFNDSFKPCCITEYGFSLSQRTKGIRTELGIESVEQFTEAQKEYSIVSAIYEATQRIRITLNAPLDVNNHTGMLFDIYGYKDNSFNFTNCRLDTVLTTDGKTFYFTVSDESTLTARTINTVPLGDVSGAKLKFQSLYSNNFAKWNYTGTTVTNAIINARFNGGKLKFGNTSGQNSFPTNTVGTTAPIYTSWALNGTYDIKNYNKPKIQLDWDNLRFIDATTDTNNALDYTRVTLTDVRPNFPLYYKNIMRIITPKSISSPIAGIVSISKSGTTTATVTTNVPHGLSANNSYVTIKGVRDQTNFASITTPVVVASTPSATTFTIVLGSAVTATSYGGAVILCNGQVDQQGIIGQTVQTASRDVLGLVTLIGSASWSGLNIGEYVDVYGCLDSTGKGLELDGAYRVFNTNTTTLVLEPIKNIDGSYVLDGEGNQMTPSTGTMVINTTNCGGAVMLRTTARLNDISAIEYTPIMVRQENEGINDLSRATPVFFPINPYINISNTFNTTAGGAGAGGAVVNPANGTFLVTASGAITSTTTTAISNTFGNAYQISVPVTAMSGTNPLLDVSIEESFDNANWFKVYDFERISTVGVYNSPTLKCNGMYLRLVQTVSGTTPSITRSIQKTHQPFQVAGDQKRMIDKNLAFTSVGSTTSVLYVENMKNIQALLYSTGSTTAPVLAIEGSEDGIVWYTIDTISGLTASGVVLKTLLNTLTKMVRAKVITAGTAVSNGQLTLKAWN